MQFHQGFHTELHLKLFSDFMCFFRSFVLLLRICYVLGYGAMNKSRNKSTDKTTKQHDVCYFNCWSFSLTLSFRQTTLETTRLVHNLIGTAQIPPYTFKINSLPLDPCSFVKTLNDASHDLEINGKIDGETDAELAFKIY